MNSFSFIIILILVSFLALGRRAVMVVMKCWLVTAFTCRSQPSRQEAQEGGRWRCLEIAKCMQKGCQEGCPARDTAARLQGHSPYPHSMGSGHGMAAMFSKGFTPEAW
jgi:hypothetical protein